MPLPLFRHSFYFNDKTINMVISVLTAVGLFILLVLAAHRWELKRRHYLPWSILMAGLAFLILYIASESLTLVPLAMTAIAVVVGGVFASIGAIMFFFFRDPERTIPADDSLIVSPADGTVVYIKEIVDGQFPFAVKNDRTIPLSEFATENLIPDRGLQIGIAMNYLNVHVNRSPIGGTVRMVKAVPGAFNSLKHLASLLENERALMVFENDQLKVGIVQIASRMVRRIVPYVEPGQAIAKGQRVGMIKFGSQVDLLIAMRDDLKVNVQVGDELIAGQSVVITCDPHHNA